MQYDIKLENVNFSHGDISIFNDINIHLKPGELTLLLGASGSGKSTIMEIAAGLILPDNGTVFWGGIDINTLSKDKLNLLRRDVGFQFQQNALISNLTVFNNVALPLRYHTLSSVDAVNVMVRHQLGRWGILDIADRLPETLSVGQARLVAIARALIMKPKLLFLDEPLSGLDPVTLKMATEKLLTACKMQETTILIITHIKEFIQSVNGRVIILENGKTKQYNSIDDVTVNSNIEYDN